MVAELTVDPVPSGTLEQVSFVLVTTCTFSTKYRAANVSKRKYKRLRRPVILAVDTILPLPAGKISAGEHDLETPDEREEFESYLLRLVAIGKLFKISCCRNQVICRL